MNIQIDQGTDPMRITVAGQPHTVDTAATAVAEIINGGNPFGAGGPASLGGASTHSFATNPHITSHQLQPAIVAVDCAS